MQRQLGKGEEMLREKDIKILRKLFSQYNYVMTTADLTASQLYYVDIKLFLERGLIERIKRGYYCWIEDYGESEIVIINRLFPVAALYGNSSFLLKIQ